VAVHHEMHICLRTSCQIVCTSLCVFMMLLKRFPFRQGKPATPASLSSISTRHCPILIGRRDPTTASVNQLRLMPSSSASSLERWRISTRSKRPHAAQSSGLYLPPHLPTSIQIAVVYLCAQTHRRITYRQQRVSEPSTRVIGARLTVWSEVMNRTL
jgi:hypothetical protein